MSTIDEMGRHIQIYHWDVRDKCRRQGSRGAAAPPSWAEICLIWENFLKEQ